MSFGRVLAALVSAIMLVAAAVMGAFVAALMFAFGLLTAAVIAGRVWWLRRTGRTPSSPHAPITDEDPRVIEAEFTVVPERPAERKQLEQ